MGKLKKWKKSEKSKVQLKKKLPKGLNVTDTTFKTRQIIVPDQLKVQKSSEPVSSKNLTVKDLVTRLSHHNDKACQDALLGLKELISDHREILVPHFQSIISSVCKLFISDVTRQIRHDVLKLLQLIFAMVSIDQINPVFDIIHWTLNCAMTHINMKIQEDSLGLFDILLKLDSSLVARMAHDILPNFLNMISKLHNERKLERTLTINLKNKVTSIKWRIEVLNHISLFLSSIVSLLRNDFPDTRESSLPKTISFNENSNFIPIYSRDYGCSSAVPYLFRRIIGEQKTSDDIYSDLKNTALIKNYIQQLFPLLFETWLEVGPGKDISEFDEKVCLSKDAADVLKCVLNIIQISWDYIYLLEQPLESCSLIDWFKSTYSKDFISYFAQNFPYVQGDSSYFLTNNARLASKHQADYKIQENDKFICLQSVEYNLIISHLFVSICDIKHPTICSKMSNFIQVCMEKKTGIPLPSLLKVLQCLLKTRNSYWITCKEMRISDILNISIRTYFTCGTSVTDREWKQELFRLLCELMLDVKLSNLHNLQIYKEWLASLPALLCVPVISIHAVEYLSKLACLNNECFQENFATILPQFIKMLGITTVDGAETQVEGKKMMANFLYWVQCWNHDTLQLLKQHMSGGSWNRELCDHIEGLLYQIFA